MTIEKRIREVLEAAASPVPAAEPEGLDHLERPNKHRQGMARGVAAIATLAVIAAAIAVTLTLRSEDGTTPSENGAVNAEMALNPVVEPSTGASGTATSTSQPMSPLTACDRFITESGENWTTARAATVTAGELVAWQEQLATASDIGLVSRYRERRASEELTVCLYWGEVPAPGVPPVDGISRAPYDASLWVIASDGSGRLEQAGTKHNLTNLPGDAN